MKRLGLIDLLFNWVIIWRALSFSSVFGVWLEDGEGVEGFFYRAMEIEDSRLEISKSRLLKLMINWVSLWVLTFELVVLVLKFGGYTC